MLFCGPTPLWGWVKTLGDGSKPWYLVNPKIAGKWMFTPLKMVLIGIDPYPYFWKWNSVCVGEDESAARWEAVEWGFWSQEHWLQLCGAVKMPLTCRYEIQHPKRYVCIHWHNVRIRLVLDSDQIQSNLVWLTVSSMVIVMCCFTQLQRPERSKVPGMPNCLGLSSCSSCLLQQ